MFSYAGVVLDFAPPDVLSRVRRHLDYRHLALWDDLPGTPARPLQALPVRAWDPWPVRNPQALPSRPWLREGPLRLNTLLWPSGASRWGVFHALVDDAAMNAIRGATGSFGQPLVIDDGVGPVLSVPMYPLPPRPLSQIPGANGFQLLTLLDRRAYWPWLSADVEVIGGTTTWADLFNAVASALGVTLAVDDVPAAYLSPPAALSGAYDSLPALLDAACLSCGLRFAAALDGISYRCWSVAAAQAQVARNLAGVTNPRVAGGLFLQGTDLNGVLPAAVQVVFPRADDGLPNPAPVVVPVTLASLNLPSNPPGGPALGGIGGLTKTFHSSAVATFASGSATNAVTLAALATQAATDFYAWQATGVYDLAYAGVAPWLPTGADGLCEYAHAPDLGSGGGILSRFRRDTYFDGQEALWHHTVTPCAAIPTRVRVVGTTLTDTCLYAAELVTRSGCADAAVSPPVPAWLRLDGGAPAAGDVHLASPEGARAADGLPVYVARASATTTGGGGVGGHIATNTTTTIDPAVTWLVTGGNVSTSVLDVTNLTYKYESTVTLVFAGPVWNVTQNTNLTVSPAVTLVFTGGSPTTSIIDVTNVTWKYESSVTLVLAGPTWNITGPTTVTISPGVTWLVAGDTFEVDAAFVFAGPLFTINGPVNLYKNVTVKDNVTVNVDAGKKLTVGGDTFEVDATFLFGGPSFTFGLGVNTVLLCGDLIFDLCPTPDPLHPDPVVDVKRPFKPTGGIKIPGPTPAPVVIDPAATSPWQIQGAVDFTGPVTGAGGLLTSQATTYTGTTADAYVTVFDLVNGQGIHGSYVVSNTGASNSAQFRVTYTDALGHVTTGAPFPVGVGQFSCFVVDEVALLNTPVVRLKLEVQSLNAGQSAAYSVILSVTAPAALSVGNGGTGSDLSATGGQGMILSQPVAGGPLAVVGPDLADLQLVGAVFGR